MESIKMSVKKSKKINKESTEARHFGVILENVDFKLDLIVEGQHSLSREMQNFRGEVDVKFNEVDFKFGVVLDELQVIRNELKEKIGRDEFAVSEKRIFNLEKKMASKLIN